MKFCALSDIHLGYRGASRIVGGRNLREQDVEQAWLHAVEVVCGQEPDLVTIAGDIFHSTRPSFHAVRAWQKGIRDIVERTRAYVVVIGGNHESPRTADALSPNVTVEGLPRVYVLSRPERLVLDLANDETVSIAAFPFSALTAEKQYTVEPHESAHHNVLLLHGAVRTTADPKALPKMYGGINAFDVAATDGFDVIACGDFHEFRRLHPERMYFYSGSIERTSSNIWQEARPKGVVVGDTERPDLLMLKPVPTREMVDLSIHDLTNDVGAAGVNEALHFLLDENESASFLEAEPLARLVVDGFPRAERDLIDWGAVSRLKERCCLFLLDLRYEEGASVALAPERGGRSLMQEAEAYFADDEPAVRDAALSYLGGGDDST